MGMQVQSSYLYKLGSFFFITYVQQSCILINFNSVSITFSIYTKFNIFLLPSTEEPELLLDANMARDHLAMLGTDITLSATIKGVPTPTISWKKDDGDIPSHVTVAVTATVAVAATVSCGHLYRV